jgi:integrase
MKDKLGRTTYEHKYKNGKPDEEISQTDFAMRLNQSKLSPRKKAYLILLYWLGCRRSEPLVIRKEDIEEDEGSLFISIHYRKDENGEPIPFSRGKRGQAGGASEVSLSLFGMDLVKEVWQKTRKGKRLFPFSDDTGYRAVLSIYPQKTPHWFRYNRVTKLRKKLGNELTIDEIKSFTGIRRDTTIQNYGMKTKAGIHKVSQHLE